MVHSTPWRWLRLTETNFLTSKRIIMKQKKLQRTWNDDNDPFIWVELNQRAWDNDTDALAWVEF